jgi:peptidyl-prolyl cis-trans isomerase SurA
MANDATPLIHIADSVITIADYVKNKAQMNPRMAQDQQVEKLLQEKMIAATLVYENHRLEQKYPEFRNISREYSEGLMLFASMQKNVWDRPTTNPEELDAYFQANREKYTFPEPRWKGYVIYATSDSLMAKVSALIEAEKPAPEQLGDLLKTTFPRNIRVERIVLPKGENAVVDHIAFGGEKPELKGRWSNYITYLGHIIEAPEEVADVRGKVTSDWVAQLEEEWMKTLRERYEVKVNKKVLKKAK